MIQCHVPTRPQDEHRHFQPARMTDRRPRSRALLFLLGVWRSDDELRALDDLHIAIERRHHCAFSCLASAAGLVLIGVFANVPVLAFAALVLSVTGVLSAFAPFWQMPTMLLAGTAAAGGIALINSLGNLSGWAAPFVVGWLQDITGKTSAGLAVVAALEVLAAVMIWAFVPHRPAGASEKWR